MLAAPMYPAARTAPGKSIMGSVRDGRIILSDVRRFECVRVSEGARLSVGGLGGDDDRF